MGQVVNRATRIGYKNKGIFIVSSPPLIYRIVKNMAERWNRV